MCNANDQVMSLVQSYIDTKNFIDELQATPISTPIAPPITSIILRGDGMSRLDELIRELCPNGVAYKNILNVLSQPITDGPHETPKLVESGVPFVSVEAEGVL